MIASHYKDDPESMLNPSAILARPLRPIHTEADYDQALAEIEALFEAEPGTPEGNRLEVLTTLVEAYEQRHYPVLPPDPA